MHSQNIMWAIDKKGNIQNEVAAFVDWQGMNEGTYGLAKFLVYCADRVVRRQAEQFAVEYYFECLCKEYEGNIDKVPYT
uniref:Uncharacterized protein n=2 Tax=Panagrolaimus sp. ES5 TaxID=591445 RepID=A0AC34FRA1_9BILA